MALPPAQIGSTAGSRPSTGAQGQPNPLLYIIGALLVVLTALQVSITGSGTFILALVVMAVGAVVIVRRPAIGILIYLTTFLFTYPSWLRRRGSSRLTFKSSRSSSSQRSSPSFSRSASIRDSMPSR